MSKRCFDTRILLGLGIAILLLFNLWLPAIAGYPAAGNAQPAAGNAQPAAGNAQPTAESTHPAIDAYIEGQMRALHIPGLAVAIVRGDQIEYVRGYGAADASGRPVTPQTPFLVASLSKSFTALGIMQLVEDGKINLDVPVQDYLPWFQVVDTEASAQLTVRHLLHHSSGFSELEGYKRNLDRNSADQALEASVQRLRKSRLNAAPGEVFEYSNTNYDILGLLIQTAAGQPYEAYIEARIFAPLGMLHSYTSLDEARRGGAASGYAAFFGNTLAYDRFMPYSRAVLPSAGLFSSAEDMARYLYAHLNQGRHLTGAAVLSPAGIAELHAPAVQISEQVSYGMGWTIFPFSQAAEANDQSASSQSAPPPVGLSHGGDWANFKALMLLVPEQQLGVVVMMNKNDPTRDVAYNSIGWNTALLAMGLEPVEFPGGEDFLSRYGKFILAIVLLLLAASFVWSWRSLSQPPAQNKVEGQRWRLIMVGLTLFDLALSGYLLFVQLPQSNSTLPLTLYFEPDIGLLYLSILVFTLGWGSLRTVLAIRRTTQPG
jgi:CubicO group peptidase (beta-lactamase class C family)